MRCLGCPEAEPKEAKKLWRKLMLCVEHHAMAEKAERELVIARDQAHERSLQWLEQHVMRGGLDAGGTGLEELETGGRREVETTGEARALPSGSSSDRVAEECASPGDDTSTGE